MEFENFLVVIILLIGFIFLISVYVKRFKWIIDKEEEVYNTICKPFEKRGYQVLKIDIVNQLDLKKINNKYSNESNRIDFFNLDLYKKIKLKKNENIIWLIIKVSENPFCTDIKILKQIKSL